MQCLIDYGKEFECYFKCNEKQLGIEGKEVIKSALSQGRNFKKKS